MVYDIKSSGDEVQRADVKVVADWFFGLSVDLPQYSDHAMEVEFPGPREGDGDVEEIPAAVVELVEEEVFVDADADILLARVVAELYVGRLPPVLEGLEEGDRVLLLEHLEVLLFRQGFVQLVVVPVFALLLLQAPRVQLADGLALFLQGQHLWTLLPRLQHRHLVSLVLLDVHHPGLHLLGHHDLDVEAGFLRP